MKRLNGLFFSTIIFIFFIGCGGGGGTSSSSPTNISNISSFSGTAVDGYISGATACLDLNINGICDSAEPTTITDNNGKFTFSNLALNPNILFSVIVRGGTDTATGKIFEGEMKNIILSNDINLGKELNVSPLTDLVATSFLQNSTKDEASLISSKSKVATALGMETITIDADTMENKKAFAKAQEVQQIKEFIKITATKAISSELTTTQQKSITLALVNQLTANSNLDVTQILTNVENELAISIPANEKTFISEQTIEIQKQLINISNDTTLDISKLDEIQSALESKLDEAKEIISNATSTNTLTKVEIPDINTLINFGETLVTNTAPYFIDGVTKISSKTIVIDENQILSLNSLAKDDNNDKLTYNLSGIDKVNFSIDSNGKLISHTFDYENALDTNSDNNYNVQVIVDDGKTKAYLDLFIKVNNLDDNTTTLSDISNVTLDKNSSTFNITLNGNDLDGTAVSYTLSSSQQNILYTYTLENNILKLSPIINKYGTDNIFVTASSNGKSVTKQFILTIQDTGALVIPTDIELPRPPMMPKL